MKPKQRRNGLIYYSLDLKEQSQKILFHPIALFYPESAISAIRIPVAIFSQDSTRIPL